MKKTEIETRVKIEEVANRVLRIRLYYPKIVTEELVEKAKEVGVNLQEGDLQEGILMLRIVKGEPIFCVGLKRVPNESLEILIEKLRKFRWPDGPFDVIRYAIRQINKIKDSK